MLGYLVLLLCALVRPSSEHGFLMTPPSRSSAWRFGFDTPPNYTDNELNCGGFSNQWLNNGGKCGECGDPWEIPVGQRPNQAGGTYATGTIVGYYQPGEVIDVAVDITANHKGWYEFRLCPVNDPSVAATWECLNQTLLEFEDGSTRFDLPDDPVTYYHRLRLPEIQCSQCVLQWLWHCGNSFGTFPNGTECTGCGPQEQFYGCADIAIGDYDSVTTTTTVSGSTTTVSGTTTTTTVPPVTTTTQPGQTTTTPSYEYDCEYVGSNSDQEAMDEWCQTNCNHEPCYCPSDCLCTPGRPC